MSWSFFLECCLLELGAASRDPVVREKEPTRRFRWQFATHFQYVQILCIVIKLMACMHGLTRFPMLLLTIAINDRQTDRHTHKHHEDRHHTSASIMLDPLRKTCMILIFSTKSHIFHHTPTKRGVLFLMIFTKCARQCLVFGFFRLQHKKSVTVPSRTRITAKWQAW